MVMGESVIIGTVVIMIMLLFQFYILLILLLGGNECINDNHFQLGDWRRQGCLPMALDEPLHFFKSQSVF